MAPYANTIREDGVRLVDVRIAHDSTYAFYADGLKVLLERDPHTSELGLCLAVDLANGVARFGNFDIDQLHEVSMFAMLATANPADPSAWLDDHEDDLSQAIADRTLLSEMRRHGVVVVPHLQRDPELLAEMVAGTPTATRLAEIGLDDSAFSDIVALVRMASDPDVDPTSIEAILQMIDETADRGGWFVLTHESDDGRLGGYRSYTAGLAERGWPELAVTGLERDQAAHLLNEIVKAYRTFDAVPVAGSEMHLEAYRRTFAMRTVGDAEKAVRMAVPRARRRSVPIAALQVLWPDPDGNLPGSEGWKGGDAQTLL